MVLSPHLDDAVLSLGQTLAHEPCVVITAFAGVPEKGTLSDYDRDCGFTSSETAMRARRTEDERAMRALRCMPTHWNYLDQQYDIPIDVVGLKRDLMRMVESSDHLFVPLGLGHPDHRRLSILACGLVDTGILHVYEELPYRIMWPEQAAKRLADLAAQGWNFADAPEPLPQGPREAKEAALRCYRSQWGDDLDPMFLCPERVWRISR